MYVVAGVTGNVGSNVADELLGKNQKVRVLVRSEEKGKRFADKGAEVAVGSLDDEAYLKGAFEGAAGAFLLLPANYATDDLPAFQRKLADAMSAAVKAAALPHVVMLSSIGGDQESGLGPIVGLNYFEGKLRETGTKLTALRPGFFMENVAMSLAPAKAQGIYPSFMPVELSIPMNAACDIGQQAALALIEPAEQSTIIDIMGPAYNATEIAAILGEHLGKDLQVVPIPPEGWHAALTQGGLSSHFADLYVEMYTGMGQGLAQQKGDKLIQGKTTLQTVVPTLK